jgi:hypothetical protein
MQTGGTIGDSLCAPYAHAHGSLASWILGYHFRSLGARDGGCSCASRPFSALLTNFACDTARTQQTAKIHDYLSAYIEGGVCFTKLFRWYLSDISALHRQYTKYQSSIRNHKNLFRTDLAHPLTAANYPVATAISETCASTSRIIWSQLVPVLPSSSHLPLSSLCCQNFRCRLPTALADEKVPKLPMSITNCPCR